MEPNWLEKAAPPIILAMMGGIADCLMSDDHSIPNVLVSVFLAGFAGYLVWLLCVEWQTSEALTGVACGIAGMSSKVVLLMIRKGVFAKLSFMLNTNKDDSGR